MSYEQISALIDRYFEGETTLEEERQLKAYFAQTPLPDARLQTVAPLFQMLKAEQAIQAPQQRPVEMSVQTGGRYPLRRWLAAASVVGVVGLSTWMLWHQPATSATGPLASTTTPPVATASVRPTAPPPAVVATTEDATDTPKTVKKPRRKLRNLLHQSTEQEQMEAEAALAEVKAALALVSRKLNRGRHEAGKHLNAIEQLSIIKSNG